MAETVIDKNVCKNSVEWIMIKSRSIVLNAIIFLDEDANSGDIGEISFSIQDRTSS